VADPWIRVVRATTVKMPRRGKKKERKVREGSRGFVAISPYF
jgi:hypothetical protein